MFSNHVFFDYVTKKADICSLGMSPNPEIDLDWTGTLAALNCHFMVPYSVEESRRRYGPIRPYQSEVRLFPLPDFASTPWNQINDSWSPYFVCLSFSVRFSPGTRFIEEDTTIRPRRECRSGNPSRWQCSSSKYLERTRKESEELNSMKETPVVYAGVVTMKRISIGSCPHLSLSLSNFRSILLVRGECTSGKRRWTNAILLWRRNQLISCVSFAGL